MRLFIVNLPRVGLKWKLERSLSMLKRVASQIAEPAGLSNFEIPRRFKSDRTAEKSVDYFSERIGRSTNAHEMTQTKDLFVSLRVSSWIVHAFSSLLRPTH